MSTTRPVRIPRAKATPSADAGSSASAPVPATSSPPASGPEPTKAQVRWNQAANERAHRLLILYLGTLAALYFGFLLLDRTSPGGTSSTAETGMLYFTGIAALLVVVGVWVALAPVPRRMELTPDGVVVVEAWGAKRPFPPVDQLQASLVHRYPRSFLSSRAVETVEITDRSGRRRTYQLEEGLVPLSAAGAR